MVLGEKDITRVHHECLTVRRSEFQCSRQGDHELQALGHTVRLMPPAYVKPYVKRHNNDAADAEAICEAVSRSNTRAHRPILHA
jgi:hypothetical protein